jgi:cystathionine beta-lyase/cystathionine gamma-synthase
VYGGTHRQMTHIWARHGLKFTFVDTADAQKIADAVTPATRMIFVETPTNPLMRLCDLAAAADIARRAKALLAVDNTFATPFFQRPLELGADVVLHSTTKYLNGHSDMIGGLLVVQPDELAARIGFIQNAAGAVPGPFDCWLCLRGTKTLPRGCASTTPTAGASRNGSSSTRRYPRSTTPASRRIPSTSSPAARCRGSAGW